MTPVIMCVPCRSQGGSSLPSMLGSDQQVCRTGHRFVPYERTAKCGERFTAKVICSIVRNAATDCGLGALAPPDLRRTCARLCHQAGGRLEQIQFLLVHVSVQTTQRYLGYKQRIQNAVTDRTGLEPYPPLLALFLPSRLVVLLSAFTGGLGFGRRWLTWAIRTVYTVHIYGDSAHDR